MPFTRIIRRAASYIAVISVAAIQTTPEIHAQTSSDSAAAPELGFSIGTAPLLIVNTNESGRMLLLSCQALFPVPSKGRIMVEIDFAPLKNAGKQQGGQMADLPVAQQSESALRVHYLKISMGVLAPVVDTPERLLETGFLFGMISHRESWHYSWNSISPYQSRPVQYPNHKELQITAEMRFRLTLGEITPKVAFEVSWLKRIARIKLDDHSTHYDYPPGVRLSITFIPWL